MEQETTQKSHSDMLKVIYRRGGNYSCVCQISEVRQYDTFVPCTKTGEPAREWSWRGWKCGWFVCEVCGRIVDLISLRVIGYNRLENALTLEECEAIHKRVKRY